MAKASGREQSFLAINCLSGLGATPPHPDIFAKELVRYLKQRIMGAKKKGQKAQRVCKSLKTTISQ
jgi:hypothetical protein